MAEFNYKSICLLGRQPSFGVAELERVYGADKLKPTADAALLDVDADEINFKQLGGTIKVARILALLDETDWPSLLKYLIDNVPQHMQHQPEGKFTLGLSLHGIDVNLTALNRDLLKLKKVIKNSGRSARIVPNKTFSLSSAQVLHNKLTHKGAWELIFYRFEKQTILAQTMFVQDIEAYAARDQARPARDARVGMLPPKLAQIMINLAVGKVDPELSPRVRVLDPFCGTGVILQEAMLMGYSVIGSDIDERMVSYSERNIQWLVQKYSKLQSLAVIEQADARQARWPGFSTMVSETFLGKPLHFLARPDEMKAIVNESNLIVKKFLQNLASQIKPGRTVCLAVPAWRDKNGKFTFLPVIDQITDMGYTRLDLKHVVANDLIYYRPDQIVARQVLILKKESDE
jgi:tRNA G10  N-methylase Trm11